MTVHFAATAWIMIGSGIAAMFLGAFLAMMFDVSEWMPLLGIFLLFCGIACAILGMGAQIAIRADIH